MGIPKIVAVTAFAASIVTVHVVPLTAVQPVQPPNPSIASVTTSVTSVGGVVIGTRVEQTAVEPVVQVIPGPVTVPEPLPTTETVTVSGYV